MSTTWKQIATLLTQAQAPLRVRIEKRDAEHPRDGNLRLTVSVPGPHRATYQLPLPDRRALLVQDFGGFYVAHLEQRPAVTPAPSSPTDGEVITAATMLGGLIGLALGRSKPASFVGLMAGAFAGAAVVAAKSSETKPAKSETAPPPATSLRG